MSLATYSHCPPQLKCLFVAKMENVIFPTSKQCIQYIHTPPTKINKNCLCTCIQYNTHTHPPQTKQKWSTYVYTIHTQGSQIKQKWSTYVYTVHTHRRIRQQHFVVSHKSTSVIKLRQSIPI